MRIPPLRSPLRVRAAAQVLRVLWRPEEVHVVAGVSCSGKSTYIERSLAVDDRAFVVGVRAFPARRGRQVRARRDRTILHWDLFNAPPEELPTDHPAWLVVRAARVLHVTLVAPDQPTLLARLKQRAELRPELPEFYHRRLQHYTDTKHLAATYIGAVDRLTGLAVTQLVLTDGYAVESFESLEDAKDRIIVIYGVGNISSARSSVAPQL